MTLDDREKLGPAEALLLEAADNRVAYHCTSADEVGAALLAQAGRKCRNRSVSLPRRLDALIVAVCAVDCPVPRQSSISPSPAANSSASVIRRSFSCICGLGG